MRNCGIFAFHFSLFWYFSCFSFLFKMRPRRSCTVPVSKPILSEIQDRMYDCSESEVRDIALSVSKYFKMDIDSIANFWFENTEGYNLKNQNHLQLLRWILESQGLKHEQSIAFLHSLDLNQIRSLGFQRVTNAQGTVFYRIRTGEQTE